MIVIKKSESPYVAPVVIVKHPDGSNRICVDYRKLNQVTVFDSEPATPTIDLFQGLRSDQFFTKIDLNN